ncbi:MAG: hypothetical protein ABI604_15760, partial [Nitrospirota bacterium]
MRRERWPHAWMRASGYDLDHLETVLYLGMPAKLYYQRLHGYTLPLVIDVFQEIGLPRAIQKVSDPAERGPLQVTLATELACVIVSLLHEGLAWGVGTEEIEDLLTERGGDDYRKALYEEKEKFEKKCALYLKINQMEQRIANLGFGEHVGNGRAKGSMSDAVDGGFIDWSTGIADSRETMLLMKNEHQKLLSKYHRLAKSANKLGNELRVLRLEIQKADDFQKALEKHLVSRDVQRPKDGKGIAINFRSTNPVLMEGAVKILRVTELRWWILFENQIKKRIVTLSKKGNARLSLRDSVLNALVKLDHKHGIQTFFAAWIDMLKNPSIMPDSILKQHRTFSSRYANPAKPDVTTPMSSGNLKYPAYTKIERKDAKELNDRDLGYWFAELRTEDASACAWIQKHAGAFHPCDWLRPIDKKSLSHWKKYPPERAINELHWCLSDGKRDLY